MEKESIKRDIYAIQTYSLNSIQVYIFFKASQNEHFPLMVDRFMKYLSLFVNIKCSDEDRFEFIENLISLNFGILDKFIIIHFNSGRLDPNELSNMQKQSLASSLERSRNTEISLLNGESIEPKPQSMQVSTGGYAGVQLQNQAMQRSDMRNLVQSSGSVQDETRAQSNPESINYYKHQSEMSSNLMLLMPAQQKSNQFTLESSGKAYSVPNSGYSNFQNVYYDNLSSVGQSGELQSKDQQLTNRQMVSSSPCLDRTLLSNMRKSSICPYCQTLMLNPLDLTVFSSCKHSLHKNCFINSVITTLNDKSIDIKCMCNQAVGESDIVNNLPQSVYTKLDEIRFQLLLESEGSSVMQCSMCKDNIHINKFYSYNKCNCGINYCSECQQEYIPGHKCINLYNPVQVCNHQNTIRTNAGVGLNKCYGCNAVLCNKCNKKIVQCICPMR